jgi:hypothetical protein
MILQMIHRIVLDEALLQRWVTILGGLAVVVSILATIIGLVSSRSALLEEDLKSNRNIIQIDGMAFEVTPREADRLMTVLARRSKERREKTAKTAPAH